jgi:DNA-directed RNA polymerase specialized sigma24 family protein
MTTEAGDEPGHAASPARLQPLTESPRADAAWLNEYDDTAASKALDRLAADQDLITTLALQSYQGPDYRIFETELAKYGMAVIGGWIRRGLIFARCSERGFGGLPAPFGDGLRHPDTIEELTLETVAKALVHFRTDVLMNNRWVSTGGATLKTFFIGQCLIRFANVYRSWHAHEQRDYVPADPHDVLDLSAERADGPEQRVIDLREVDRALEYVDDVRLKKALVLIAAGMSHAEVGLQLGVSTKTVAKMVENHLKRLKKKGIA